MTKIHSIDPDNWNAHAALGRAQERTTTKSKLVVCWMDDDTKEIRYATSCDQFTAHYMLHRVASEI